MAGTSVDPPALRNMANQLRQSTTTLDGLANAEPAMPIVTTSSSKVGETISELMKAMAALMAGVADIADQIHASDASYGQVDNQAGADLHRAGEGVR